MIPGSDFKKPLFVLLQVDKVAPMSDTGLQLDISCLWTSALSRATILIYVQVVARLRIERRRDTRAEAVTRKGKAMLK
jgi:hypothetical protein